MNFKGQTLVFFRLERLEGGVARKSRGCDDV